MRACVWRLRCACDERVLATLVCACAARGRESVRACVHVHVVSRKLGALAASLTVKTTVVPLLGPEAASSSVTTISLAAAPRLNRIVCSLPDRRTATSRCEERAFTTETPTPCKPAETL